MSRLARGSVRGRALGPFAAGRQGVYWPPLWGVLALVICSTGSTARAGGSEFPADGTRGLGRGGSGFARADDPTVMLRNPALLADLWADQALLGAHLLLADACFQPTGGYGWGVQGASVLDVGDGPVHLQAPEGSTNLDGTSASGFLDEPYPRVCFDGPAPFLPSLALTKKLANDLGVGLGFFPPEVDTLSQWGDRDGTVATPRGRRPNPLRYFGSHTNVSYFSLLGAVGYRLSDWLRLGAGFQWSLVVFSSTAWAVPLADRSPHRDVRTEAFGRDLFIPAFVVSAHVVPLDNLDIAVGFKWADRLRANAKLDITTGAFGVGEPYSYRTPDGALSSLGSTLPTTFHNVPGEVEVPPIWVPQLSLGARYAQRLKPRVREGTWDSTRRAVGSRVEDAMESELWDIELDAIVYFNSVNDRTSFTSDPGAQVSVELREVPAAGAPVSSVAGNIGDCLGEEVNNVCRGRRQNTIVRGGREHVSVRLGGDYNLLPGVLALRSGLSYESDGQDREYMTPMNYMFSRFGLHAGLTLRIAGATDLSLAFGHFIQDAIRLQVNPATRLRPSYRTEEYNFAPGLGEPDSRGDNAQADSGFDGIAQVEAPYGGQDEPGPNFINAGTYRSSLSVVSVSLSQHF